MLSLLPLVAGVPLFLCEKAAPWEASRNHVCSDICQWSISSGIAFPHLFALTVKEVDFKTMWGNRRTYKTDATWREQHSSIVAPPVVNTQPQQESSLAPEGVTGAQCHASLSKPPSSPLLVSMVVVKEQGIWSWRSQAEIPAPSFINWIILSNILILSEPQFPHLKNKVALVIESLRKFNGKLWI